MLKTRVAVLRGGPSSEYEVSLKTGQSVLANLPKETYATKEIFIDRLGTWHVRGMPVEAARALDQVDVVFNALHGAYGEDGTVQRFLETHGKPYTGSGPLGSALGMNKALAKNHLGEVPFKLPIHRVVRIDEHTPELTVELWRTFPQPSVVKPLSGGSSLGTHIAVSFDELSTALREAFSVSDTVLVEQYIRGREVTVGVVEGFRGESHYALPPIEILPSAGQFFDYEEKYSGRAREVCPAPLPHDRTRELLDAARLVHKRLHLRDYSRSDFIISRHGIFFLEVNTLPGLTDASLVPKALEAVGATLPHFLDHVVRRACARR